jgi:hypothetical protein
MFQNGPGYTPTPPPLPRRSGGSFGRQAAMFSLLAPLVAITMAAILMGMQPSPDGSGVQWGKIVVGGIGALLVLAGFVLAIVALSLMTRVGRRGILGFALAGLILNASVVALGVIPLVLKVRNRMKAEMNLQKSMQQAQEEARKESQGGTNYKSAQDRLSTVEKSIDDLASESSGDNALALKASRGYLQRLQVVSAKYTSGLQELEGAHVMDMSGVERREQLTPKRDAVQRFMASNEEFKSFLTNAENIFKEEMVAMKVPQKTFDQALEGFHSKAYINNTLIKIRDTDRQIGEGMLGVVDLLDEHWGKWTYNTERKRLVFAADGSLEQYSAFLAKIQKASKEQKRLQEQVVNFSK